MKKLELTQISKYRTELMGIAAIGNLLCHAGANHVALGVLLPVFALAQLGNALFFLLSGYGLFFSLHKLTFTPQCVLSGIKRGFCAYSYLI